MKKVLLGILLVVLVIIILITGLTMIGLLPLMMIESELRDALRKITNEIVK